MHPDHPVTSPPRNRYCKISTLRLSLRERRRISPRWNRVTRCRGNEAIDDVTDRGKKSRRASTRCRPSALRRKKVASPPGAWKSAAGFSTGQNLSAKIVSCTGSSLNTATKRWYPRSHEENVSSPSRIECNLARRTPVVARSLSVKLNSRGNATGQTYIYVRIYTYPRNHSLSLG